MCTAGVAGVLSAVLVIVLVGMCARYFGGDFQSWLAPIDDEVVLVQVDSISNPH
jgi:hypothetical protein